MFRRIFETLQFLDPWTTFKFWTKELNFFCFGYIWIISSLRNTSLSREGQGRRDGVPYFGSQVPLKCHVLKTSCAAWSYWEVVEPLRSETYQVAFQLLLRGCGTLNSLSASLALSGHEVSKVLYLLFPDAMYCFTMVPKETEPTDHGSEVVSHHKSFLCMH